MNIANIAHAVSFVSGLEADLRPESLYRQTLEGIIAELVDATFESTDPNEKALLATVEMRARLILDRWKKLNLN